ncbi:hypothetical protein PHABIO_257 [Pseudomonas phage Phabio]|uniref:Uncharacterized protein n=1 Tax=Pseudomonas phage Phabio TaxID=2006668 RepID=A0A1Y0T075_9CAUD|nr:hypothetical protein MZD05_gp257 [Pseudomonas phage Phabio]ARV76888.1 hypothetical protein PHABIO_257 [Pseudomonas phage Phabio]
MKVEITPQHGKNPGININGPQITDIVWQIFNYSIGSNRYECPWYKARQEAGAFFQGGSGENTGWIFIELGQPAHGFKYLNMINRALAFVDDNGEPVKVRAIVDTDIKRKYIAGLTRFYECSVTYEKNVATFTPNDSAMITAMVEKNIEWGNTFTPATLPVGPSDLIFGLCEDLKWHADEYISDEYKRKQLINDLRSVADQLQLTLTA